METKAGKYATSQSIGCFGVIFLLGGSIVSGGAAGSFIDVPSAMLTLGVTFFILIFMHGKDALKFMQAAGLVLVGIKPPHNKLYSEIARDASRIILGSGAIGTLIGIINMLQNIDDPSRLGAGAAVSLLTLFYAALISQFIFVPLGRMFSKGNSVAEEDKYDALKNLFMIIGIVVCLGVVLCIVIFTLDEMSSHSESFYPNKQGNISIVHSGKKSQVTISGLEANLKVKKGVCVLSFDLAIDVDSARLLGTFMPLTHENPKGQQGKIKAQILSIISDKELNQVTGAANREKLAGEIERMLNKVFFQNVPGVVTDIYFTKFLIQKDD